MNTPTWNPTLGAIWDGTDTHFRIWAPACGGITAMVKTADGKHLQHPLAAEPDGYFAGVVPGVKPGDRYRYLAEGKGEFPDPWSRWQPDGVHGFSAVADPNTFDWTDNGWAGVKLDDAVIYELHVGTFTPEGTYAAASKKLPFLKDLGITVVELLPLADFPGNRNWGYDGVNWFAPARCYGTPDELRALVNEAHKLGLAVMLDAVYNHLGPDGNYISVYSDKFFTERHHTPWGAAINYDGPDSEAVRRLVIESVLHWVLDYHIDGLRLDATHAIIDDGPKHFLQELTETVKSLAPDRTVLVIAEDDRNETKLVKAAADGGYGLDGAWADDFHHVVRRKVAGDDESYFRDYTGTTEELAKTIRQGWLYTGQLSLNHKHKRGTDTAGVPPMHMVVCIQNHDQIGNRALGDRLNHNIDADLYKAATVLLLGVPETPLLFMGQEWAASSPFCYFTEHNPQLGKLVTEGRRKEFGQFKAFADPAVRATIPDPQAWETFKKSKLNWDEVATDGHAEVLELYRAMLAWRRGSAALKAARTGRPFEVKALGPDAVMVDYGAERVVVAFAAGEYEATGEVIVTSGGATVTPSGVRFARPGGVVIRV